MQHKLSIAVIGCGNLGSVIARSLESRKVNVLKVDSKFESQPKENVYSDLLEITEVDLDAVILAVKPQGFHKLCQRLIENSSTLDSKLTISILAGVTVEKIQSVFQDSKVVRVMPNLPAVINEGAAAYYSSTPLNNNEESVLRYCFEEMCPAFYQVHEESLLDIVTALSGSGPAFFLAISKALMDKAVELGLPEDLAKDLVLQTMKGSACWGESVSESLDTLCQKVSSKGGTTEAGLEIYNRYELSRLLGQVLESAVKRAHELARLN